MQNVECKIQNLGAPAEVFTHEALNFGAHAIRLHAHSSTQAAPRLAPFCIPAGYARASRHSAFCILHFAFYILHFAFLQGAGHP